MMLGDNTWQLFQEPWISLLALNSTLTTSGSFREAHSESSFPNMGLHTVGFSIHTMQQYFSLFLCTGFSTNHPQAWGEPAVLHRAPLWLSEAGPTETKALHCRPRHWSPRAEDSPGMPVSPRSSPGPPALTLWAPPSPSGPTVNWKGLPCTGRPLYLTSTVWTPISCGTKRTQ